MKMQRVVLLLVVALLALSALAPVHADPREIENAECASFSSFTLRNPFSNDKVTTIFL